MKILNIGVLAHVDAGKTTITENLLYESGTINALGRVDKGDTLTDSMDLEKKKGITIKATTTSLFYKGVKINIIDTPGHMEFIAEVERSLKVLDMAILVISAKEGIQAQTKVIFDNLKRLDIPIMILINKIDRIGVNLNKIDKEIKAYLTSNVFKVQDVNLDDLSIKSLWGDNFDNKLKEYLLNNNTKLEDKFFNEIDITNCDYNNALKEIINSNKSPILYCSGLKNIGIDKVLDFIVKYYIKDTIDVGSRKLKGIVYKIERVLSDKYIYMKILEGSIKERENYEKAFSDGSYKVKNLCAIEKGKLKKVEEVGTNDIAVILNTNELKIGDIIGLDLKDIIKDENKNKPVLESSIRLKSGDRQNLIKSIYELAEEDPDLYPEIKSSTDEIVIKLYGDVQKEIIEDELLNRYKLDVEIGDTKTIYKETISKESYGLIHIEEEPNPYWASIGLRIEPMPRNSGISYQTEVSYGYLRNSFQNAVEESIYEEVKHGLLGWELTDFKIVFDYGLYYSPVSTPADFRALTPYALDLALNKIGTVLLEPFYNFTLQLESDHVGKAVGDVQKMKGNIHDIKDKEGLSIITGELPVNNSKNYQREVLSYTNGEGVFITELQGYKECINSNEKNSNYKEDVEIMQLKYMFRKLAK